MAQTKKLAEVDMVEYTDNTSLICEQDGKIRRISAGKVLGDTILSATSTNIVTGEKITISDSLEAPLAGLNIYGKSTQKTTTGANLFDGSEYSKKTSSGITVEWLEEEGCFLLNGTATKVSDLGMPLNIVAEKGAAYTAQIHYDSGKISVPDEEFAVIYFGASDTEDSSNNWLSCRLEEKDGTGTMQCNYNYITRFWFYITTGVALNNYRVRVQLAKSSASLPYEPYTGGIPSPNCNYPQEIETIQDFTLKVSDGANVKQELSITIPEQSFCGIPVRANGNYTDSENRQWICDEFDYKKQKFVKNVGRIQFDGSADESWILNATTASKARFYVNIPGAKTKSGAECLCNRLIYGTSGESGYCFTSNSRFYIDVEASLNTVELLRTYLSTHTLDVIYQLETPIETDLSDEEIQAFKELHTYKNTTIMSDSEPQAGMKAEYALDMKTYVDNKFLELATQVLENA